MRSDVVETMGEMDALARRRLLFDRHAGPPFLCRPDRPGDKTAAAVRAHIVELVLDAVRTEGALVTADARFQRMRRKVLVAIFAVRPKLQRHGRLVTSERSGSSQNKRRIRMTNTPRFRPPSHCHSGM